MGNVQVAPLAQARLLLLTPEDTLHTYTACHVDQTDPTAVAPSQALHGL
jgi:hypothetical protein